MNAVAFSPGCVRDLGAPSRVPEAATRPAIPCDWLLATADADGKVKLWKAAYPWDERLDLTPHAQSVNALAFSPDSRLVAMASQEGTAEVWDVKTGRLQQTFASHTGPVQGVAFESRREAPGHCR